MAKEVAGWDPNTVNVSASQWGLSTSGGPQDPALGPVLLSIFNMTQAVRLSHTQEFCRGHQAEWCPGFSRGRNAIQRSGPSVRHEIQQGQVQDPTSGLEQSTISIQAGDEWI